MKVVTVTASWMTLLNTLHGCETMLKPSQAQSDPSSNPNHVKLVSMSGKSSVGAITGMTVKTDIEWHFDKRAASEKADLYRLGT